MRLRNDRQGYGLVSVLLHWVMAILIIGLFFLGEYMVDLDYYHPWYQKAPDLHRSLGMLVALLIVFRLGWRLTNSTPEPIGKRWEQYAAAWLHRLFYALIAAIVISGYLVATADGQALPIFGWFTIPATLSDFENQAEIAGVVHEWLTQILIVLVVLHGLAALKHHFIDRDSTLRRMLGLHDVTLPSSSTATKPKG